MGSVPTLRASITSIIADLVGRSARDGEPASAGALSRAALQLGVPLHGAIELGDDLPPVPWIALGWHTGALRRVILDAKFEAKIEPWRGLAYPLANAIEQWWEGNVGGGLTSTEVVVPVPVAWSRRFTRGPDHVELLSLVLAGRLGLQRLHPLRRTGLAHSIGVSGKERRERASQFRARKASKEDIQGLSVIVVDDVQTTGATIRACARELLRLGAPRVLAVTASLTPCPGEDLREASQT